MNGSQSYEHSVKQKTEGIWIVRRILLVTLYVVFAGIWIVIGFRTAYIFPLAVISVILTWTLVFFTWKYVKVEYEYSVTSGVLTFSKIYGKRKRKVIFETLIKNAFLISPYKGVYIERAGKFRTQRVYNALPSSSGNQNAYIMIFEDDDEEKAAFLFEGDEKVLNIFKSYNPSSTFVR